MRERERECDQWRPFFQQKFAQDFPKFPAADAFPPPRLPPLRFRRNFFRTPVLRTVRGGGRGWARCGEMNETFRSSSKNPRTRDPAHRIDSIGTTNQSRRNRFAHRTTAAAGQRKPRRKKKLTCHTKPAGFEAGGGGPPERFSYGAKEKKKKEESTMKGKSLSKEERWPRAIHHVVRVEQKRRQTKPTCERERERNERNTINYWRNAPQCRRADFRRGGKKTSSKTSGVVAEREVGGDSI